MQASTVSSALLQLAAAVFVGRVVLALLPAGLPGRHSARGIAATLGTSYLLGSIVIQGGDRLLGALHIHAAPWVLALPWIFVAIARWLALPGALLPRREREPERAGPLVRAAPGLVVIAIAIIAWNFRDAVFPRADELGARSLAPGLLGVADVVALVVVSDHALHSARRPAIERAFVAVMLAVAVALPPFARGDLETVRLALCFGAGIGFAIPWLRVADRRALVLATISFAGASLVSRLGACLGFIGLALLFACSARPSRKRAATAGSIAFALGIAFAASDPPFVAQGRGTDARLAARAAAFLVLASAFAATWMLAAWNHWRARLSPLELGGAGARSSADERESVSHGTRKGELGTRESEPTSPVSLDHDAAFVAEIGAATLIALLVCGEWTREFARIEAIPLFAPILFFSAVMALGCAEWSVERT